MSVVGSGGTAKASLPVMEPEGSQVEAPAESMFRPANEADSSDVAGSEAESPRSSMGAPPTRASEVVVQVVGGV